MAPALALLGAIVLYTAANLAVARGSTDGLRSALRSRVWWAGACLQGLGFACVFFARGQLPLIVVQPALLLSLASTVLVGFYLRWWGMTRVELAGVVGVVCGAGIAAAASESGPAAVLSWEVVAPCAGTLLTVMLMSRIAQVRAMPWLMGGLCGVALGVAAILTRGLASHPEQILSNAAMSAGAVVALAALAAGELLLTEGLASGRVGETLATMYVVTTAGPVLGAALLVETAPFASPGSMIVALAGLVVACASCVPLADPARVQRSWPALSSGHAADSEHTSGHSSS